MDPLLLGLGLLGAALLLIVVEVFVPSAGLISLIATALAITEVAVLFRESAAWGLAGMLSMLLLGPTVAFFALQVLPSTKMGRKMLGVDEPPDDDDDAPQGPPDAADAPALALGDTGVAVTDLRPVGTARLDRADAATGGTGRVQVVSEVGYVPAGSRVRVTSISGTTVRVRPVT